jgi:putative peptidoglycan lipid II flippase
VGTSYAFAVYSLGLVTLSLESLVVYSFFALSNTKTPVTVGIICVILDIMLALVFLKPLGYLGIAGAFVISKTVKVVILFGKLNTELDGLFSVAVFRFMGKLAAATAASAAGMFAISAIKAGSSLISVFSMDLLFPSAGAILVFVICSRFLGMDEYRQILSLFTRRILVVEPAGEASL